MERYTVTVVHPDNSGTIQLLIPLHHEKPVAALIGEVALRFAKRSALPVGLTFELHLWQQDGPVVDADDLLKDVALDPRVDIIFATATERLHAAAHAQNRGQDEQRVVVSSSSLKPSRLLATIL